jgi:hypothetical protein
LVDAGLEGTAKKGAKVADKLHSDEAFDAVVHHLAQLAETRDHRGQRSGPRETDFYLPDFVWNFWFPHLDRSGGRYMNANELEQERFTPFYDAAWELCRIGVLRPGEFSPRGMSHPKMFGDHYVITAFGREWLQSAKERTIIDSGRLAELLNTFSIRFGDGYAQRASEAVRTYRSELARCERHVRRSSRVNPYRPGRRQVWRRATCAENLQWSGWPRGHNKMVVHGVRPSLQQHLENALLVLQYWRDNASHGLATSITEIEAHASIMQLLRLAQFADKNWDSLTARGP